jgi:hypothetical protein
MSDLEHIVTPPQPDWREDLAEFAERRERTASRVRGAALKLLDIYTDLDATQRDAAEAGSLLKRLVHVAGIAGIDLSDIHLDFGPGNDAHMNAFQEEIAEDTFSSQPATKFIDIDSISVRALGLTGGAHSGLLWGNVSTVGKLVNMSESELLGLKGIGPKAVTLIKNQLGNFGLGLRNCPVVNWGFVYIDD